jgi:predicted permease
MEWLRRLRFKLSVLFRDPAVEAEVAEEMSAHLERLIARNRDAGMSAEQARRTALREFGNVALLQEHARDARRFAWLECVCRDLTYAWRQLRVNPSFAVTAVLSLTLGVGASVTMFSAVNTILFRDLPLPHADRLAILRKGPRGGTPERGIAPADALEMVERLRPVAAAAPFTLAQFEIRGQGSAERVSGVRVGAAFFSTLEITPPIGRDFVASDDRLEAERVAIISSVLARRYFGSGAAAVGHQLDVGSDRLTIVGVLPDGFRFPNFLSTPDPDVWTPLAFHPIEAATRGAGYMNVLLKRHSGVAWELVERELDVVSREYEKTQPRAYGNQQLRAIAAHEQVVGRSRPMLLLLWACVTSVLLISCANTANLVLSRAAARSRELAVRASIGASRVRLFSQLVTESLLLAGVASALGLAFAVAAIALTRQALAFRLPRAEEITIDWRVLLFTVSLAVLTSLIVGLVPAYRLSAVAPRDALTRAGTRGSTEGPWAARARRVLLIGQIAIAVVLGATAALLGRSLLAALRADLGFRAESLLTVELSIMDRTLSPAAVTTLYDRITDALQSQPAVAAAGAFNLLPLSGADFGWGYEVFDRPVANGSALPSAEVRIVTPGTLETLGVPIRAGRSFARSDRADSQLVALVNETFARQTWPDANAIGRQIKLAGQPWLTVVGVVGDVRLGAPDRPAAPTIYRPQSQHRWRDMTLVVRARQPRTDIAPIVRAEIERLGGAVGVLRMREFSFYLSQSVADRRLVTSLVAAFAVIAVTIALVGVYGVFAYAVTSRTRDIGVRLALGAGRGRIVRSVLREALGLGVTGALAGIVMLFAERRLIEAQLYEMTAMDAGTLAAMTVMILMTALLACYVPARRASRVDPTAALRVE